MRKKINLCNISKSNYSFLGFKISFLHWTRLIQHRLTIVRIKWRLDGRLFTRLLIFVGIHAFSFFFGYDLGSLSRWWFSSNLDLVHISRERLAHEECDESQARSCNEMLICQEEEEAVKHHSRKWVKLIIESAVVSTTLFSAFWHCVWREEKSNSREKKWKVSSDMWVAERNDYSKSVFFRCLNGQMLRRSTNNTRWFVKVKVKLR